MELSTQQVLLTRYDRSCTGKNSDQIKQFAPEQQKWIGSGNCNVSPDSKNKQGQIEMVPTLLD